MTEQRASPTLVISLLATLVLSIASTMIWVATADRPAPEARAAQAPINATSAPEPRGEPEAREPRAPAPTPAAEEAPRDERLFKVQAQEGSLLRAASGVEIELDRPEEPISAPPAPRPAPVVTPRPVELRALGPIEVSPEIPMWSEAVTITAPGGGFVRWGINNWQRPPDALKTTLTYEVDGVFETPLNPEDRLIIGPFALDRDIKEINFVVRRPDGAWSQNRTLRLEAKNTWSDRTRLGQGPVTVFTRRPGLVHFGTNGWQNVRDKDLVGPDANGLYRAELGELGDVASLEYAIKHADGSWDNNNGHDFRLVR